MADHVCQHDCKAYRLFGAPGEFTLEGLLQDFIFQTLSNDCDEENACNYSEYREWSLGIAAWQVIGFALERGWPIPPEVYPYLQHAADGINDWAALNGHPGELKGILKLQGTRKQTNEQGDPRWIYAAISQMREHNPKATIKSLVQDCMRRFPQVGHEEDYVRQKYYQGKRLAEKGADYKGRGRKREISNAPVVILDLEKDF